LKSVCEVSMLLRSVWRAGPGLMSSLLNFGLLCAERFEKTLNGWQTSTDRSMLCTVYKLIHECNPRKGPAKTMLLTAKFDYGLLGLSYDPTELGHPRATGCSVLPRSAPRKKQ
jgi:hypothetical protein